MLQETEPASSNSGKQPFPHQQVSFEKLNQTFTFAKEDEFKGGLLVLPTGAGKTFTAVRWLSQHVIPKNWKILWLAQSFYLLEQAYEVFRNENPSRKLNIRMVSSDPGHDRPDKISPTDDVVIITTPSAIKNLHLSAVDNHNQPVKSNLMRFVEASRETGLFVVLDEAHHAPAYGCRNLLVSEDLTMLGLKELVKTCYLLGLTATPTYNDEARRGWLGKIFKQGILYQAERAELIAQGILARPNYIEKPTGREFIVNASLYNKLVLQHGDLPETIIQELAGDHMRNDYIVAEYLRNRDTYGKTIIFADRWYQCVYIKEKLKEKGVKVDAVYSHIDADPGLAEARNKRDASENGRIMNRFKYGQGEDRLDVLVNVRMLTEGVDVPQVRTVFVTRQTTSPILMTQMVGRALRGPKAGGEAEANLVLFTDNWKGLLPDIWSSLDGEALDSRGLVRGHYPLEFISIRLVEQLAKDIDEGIVPDMPFLHFVPVGWYMTEIAVKTAEDSEEIQVFQEFVMVYEHNKPKFDVFLVDLPKLLTPEWGQEYLEAVWVQGQVETWLARYFDREQDDLSGSLEIELVRLARHYAQKQTLPEFYPFQERDRFDLDKFTDTLLNASVPAIYERCNFEFSKAGNLWRVFYKTPDRFIMASLASLARQAGMAVPPPNGKGRVYEPVLPRTGREPSLELTTQVKNRDRHVCLACGASGQGVRLQMDHIVPWALSGETVLENLQTLCSICNKVKDINEINFRSNVTQLMVSKGWEDQILKRILATGRTERVVEDASRSLRRLINFFYHCQAVYQLDIHKKRNGSNYARWKIQLYQGNDPAWLLNYRAELLQFIQKDLKCPQVTELEIV